MDGPNAEHLSRLAAGDPLALKWERRHATAERARIRRELKERIARIKYSGPMGVWRVDALELDAAINEICPEEEPT